jgi:hypothetical protein
MPRTVTISTQTLAHLLKAARRTMPRGADESDALVQAIHDAEHLLGRRLTP